MTTTWECRTPVGTSRVAFAVYKVFSHPLSPSLLAITLNLGYFVYFVYEKCSSVGSC